MKVAILGLIAYENLGDQFIGKTVDWLVKQYDNVETNLLDFSFINCKPSDICFSIRLVHKIVKILKLKRMNNLLLFQRYKYYYSKTLFNILKECDAIIFSCGSFKYGTQDLWAQYSAVIDYADEKKIPVMFNAMNVQKYDKNNFKCQILKQHLNRLCVKYFTSRDGQAGVERLKKYYVINDELKIFPAADPGFWISETYHVDRNIFSNIIGINVIAPDRFIVYGGNLSPQALKKAYIEMIKRLIDNNYQWQLFTNGMKDDNDFAIELAEHFHSFKSKNILCIPKSDHELVKLIANYKGIFGARLHSMICAYSLCVPVAGFIWDEKIIHFAEMAKIKNLFLEEKMFRDGQCITF